MLNPISFRTDQRAYASIVDSNHDSFPQSFFETFKLTCIFMKKRNGVSGGNRYDFSFNNNVNGFSQILSVLLLSLHIQYFNVKSNSYRLSLGPGIAHLIIELHLFNVLTMEKKRLFFNTMRTTETCLNPKIRVQIGFDINSQFDYVLDSFTVEKLSSDLTHAFYHVVTFSSTNHSK